MNMLEVVIMVMVVVMMIMVLMMMVVMVMIMMEVVIMVMVMTMMVVMSVCGRTDYIGKRAEVGTGKLGQLLPSREVVIPWTSVE